MACKQFISENSADDWDQTNLYQYFWSVFNLIERIPLKKEKTLRKRFLPFSPDKTKRCLAAVVFQQCVYSSNAIVNCFLQCLNQNLNVKNELFSKKEIRICCLGGGQGTEAIGIGEAIQSMSQREADKIIDMHITIIDKFNIWKDVILETALINQYFPINNCLQWKFDFIKEDYLQPLSKKAELYISKADCLTLSKFSSLLGMKKKKIKRKIKNILQLTKKNALIYYYEDSEEIIGSALNLVMNDLKSFQKMYKNFDQYSLNLSDMASVLYRSQLQEFVFQRWPYVATTIWFRVTMSEEEEELKKDAL